MATDDRLVATQPLFIGRFRAANPGDLIPRETVEANGWQDGVQSLEESAFVAGGGVDLSKSVPQILEAVGNDATLAASTLEQENAAAQPRSTLVDGLQAVIAANQP